MATDWADVALKFGALVGPLADVYLGATFGRRTARDTFLREHTLREITRRREVHSTFRKALWAYSARAKTIRNLTEKALEEEAVTGTRPEVGIFLEQTRQRQEDARDAFADLELFSSHEAQVAARASMQALTTSIEAAGRFDLVECAAAMAHHEKTHEDYSLTVNKDLEHFNALLYSAFTPVWRAILGRVVRRPLPFKASTAPSDLSNPQERLLRKIPPTQG